ncbi:DUF5696 domain-containing protein [Paenibacillus sp. MBLB4367]|uniref:DUF5696 domain-containing protein n=1 Tax=Paenibacillus sp. MBLB4367 TaxID=3384767 RepID=UPI0039080E0D
MKKRMLTAGICLTVLIGFSGSVLMADTKDSGGGQPGGAGQPSAAGQGSGLIAAATSSQSSVSGAPLAAAVPIKAPDRMELMAENGVLQLYMNKTTTEIAVADKRSGAIWYSNPQDRDKDKIAAAINKSNLSSQLIVSYFDEKGHETVIDNYQESIARKQFEIVKTDKGVKVVYQIGNFQKGIELIPRTISKKRMDENILGKIKDETVKNMITTRFFLNEEKQVYERKDMADYIVKDIVAVLESIGYTAEDVALDNEQNGGGDSKKNVSPRFTIPVEYVLEGDNFRAGIPGGQIGETPEFPLHTVQLLPFFASAGTDKNGYMFVPDGSGALIHLNNQKKSSPSYEVPLYGKDETPLQKREPQQSQKSRLPVFGMKQDDQAVVAIIEKGDALATVKADTSGKLNAYNSVSGMFELRTMEMFRYRAGRVSKETPQFSPLYQGDVALRYAFLSGSSAGYVGMAKTYRNYLVQTNRMRKLEAGADTPFMLQLAGSIPTRQTFLGIPYQSVDSLTSFEQATKLLGELKQKGLSRMRVQYTGWFNGGITHRYPDDIAVDGALGGESGFKSFIRYAESNRIELFPDVSFLRVYEDGHGFKPSRDAARFMERTSAKRYDVNPVTLRLGDFAYYVLSPGKLPGLVDSFLADYGKFKLKGLSLRDLGEDVNSDVKAKAVIDRQKSAGLNAESVKKVADTVGSAMVSGGNAYAIPFAQTIVNAPLSSSRFSIADEEVPFFQIVLHGYADYAGVPANLDTNQDTREQLLKTLETGASVYYEWFYEQPSAVKETKFNGLYSSYYEDWMDEALQVYMETNKVLKDVQGQTIEGHEKLADNVFRTTYEKGKTITVNYNDQAVTVNGVRIEAQGYVVGGEAK